MKYPRSSQFAGSGQRTMLRDSLNDYSLCRENARRRGIRPGGVRSEGLMGMASEPPRASTTALTRAYGEV